MWIARLSPRMLRSIIFSEFILFIVVPNVLVRLVHPIGLIRPAFLTAAEISLIIVMLFGLYGEGSHLYHDVNYRYVNSNLKRYLIIGPIGLIFIIFGIQIPLRQTTDLLKVYIFHASLREITTTVVDRESLPMGFIIAEGLKTTEGRFLTLPYSDLPAIGGTYKFRLLPKEDMVVYYEPVREMPSTTTTPHL
jgi:hypothetical protein